MVLAPCPSCSCHRLLAHITAVQHSREGPLGGPEALNMVALLCEDEQCDKACMCWLSQIRLAFIPFTKRLARSAVRVILRTRTSCFANIHQRPGHFLPRRCLPVHLLSSHALTQRCSHVPLDLIPCCPKPFAGLEQLRQWGQYHQQL